MKTDEEILAGPPTMGGSQWMGDHWTWFVEWNVGERVLKRIEGTAVDHVGVVNQQRATAGLPAIQVDN